MPNLYKARPPLPRKRQGQWEVREPWRPPQNALVFLDYHRVLDVDFRQACSALQLLNDRGIAFCVLSFCHNAQRLQQQGDFLARLSHETELEVRVVRSQSPLGKNGKASTIRRISEAQSLTRVAHIDDRRDIIEEINSKASYRGCAIKGFCFDSSTDWRLSVFLLEVIRWIETQE
jgi:hypothetical protein